MTIEESGMPLVSVLLSAIMNRNVRLSNWVAAKDPTSLFDVVNVDEFCHMWMGDRDHLFNPHKLVAYTMNIELFKEFLRTAVQNRQQFVGEYMNRVSQPSGILEGRNMLEVPLAIGAIGFMSKLPGVDRGPIVAAIPGIRAGVTVFGSVSCYENVLEGITDISGDMSLGTAARGGVTRLGWFFIDGFKELWELTPPTTAWELEHPRDSEDKI